MNDEPGAIDVGGDRPESLRHRLIYLALLLTTVGCLVTAIGFLMPAYTDPVAAERIRSGLECEPGVSNASEDRRCPDELWYRSMNSVRTNKWRLVDGGAGLLVSGLTICLFLWWFRGKSWAQLSTPKSSLWIIALAGMVWLLQIPAYDLQFVAELARGYHPHWADSIAIPISQVDSILLWLFLPYMAVWLLFVVGARLPALVFSNISGRPLANAFWTGATALLLVPIVLVLIGAILDGPTMMVPFLWLTVWLALCARAAALSRHGRRSAQ